MPYLVGTKMRTYIRAKFALIPGRHEMMSRTIERFLRGTGCYLIGVYLFNLLV